MQVTVKGRNTSVPERLRAHTERKLAKMRRFDQRIVAMDVEFSEERNPRVAPAHHVEVTLTTRHRQVRARADADDPAAALDQVVDRLQRLVKKAKGRRLARAPLPAEPAAATAAPSGEDSGESAIVRSKRVEMKPMTPEEAIAQMTLVGHDFFLFANAQSGQAGVVYRRRNGGFGLIEPEI